MIENLVRPNIRNLIPYTCARDLYQDGILLDANENALGSVVRIPYPVSLNRYPDPYCTDLKRGLSRLLRVSRESLFVGSGSDEIIDLLIRIFVGEGEEVLIFEPTYGMYRVAASAHGVRIRTCILSGDFQLDPDAFENAVSPKTKVAFCCSPNSPTGNRLRTGDIEALCLRFNGIVVLDEAYVEFASGSSLVSSVKKFRNLVVLRTFSKAWGLAGLRVGYAVAHPQIVRYLNKVKLPYNLNSFSAYLALQAIQKKKKLESARRVILRERKKLASALRKVDGFQVFPSETNFLLVRTPGASVLADRLARRFGIIVRDVSEKPRLENCLRITVGTPGENRRLLQAMVKLA